MCALLCALCTGVFLHRGRHVGLPLRPLTGNIGNQSFGEGRFLDMVGHVPGVHNQAINGYKPGHWVPIHATGQRPFRVHQADIEHVADLFGFTGGAAFANAKMVADVADGNGRRLTAVEGEIDRADGVDDTGSPILQPPTGQGRRPFPAQLGRHQPAHIGVLFIQLFMTETVGQGRNGLISFLHIFGNGIGVFHCFSLLVVQGRFRKSRHR
jgi:hypothetical protein